MKNFFSLLAGSRGRRNSPPPAARPGLWAGTGALAGAVTALLLFAPAQWLADAVQGWSSQRVVLADARGTVWNGTAGLMLTGGAGSRDVTTLPGRIQWTLAPTWSGLALRLAADCCTPQALQIRVSPRVGGWQADLASAQAQGPAQLLAGLGTPWNTLQPEGQLVFQSTGLRAQLSEGRLQLSGSAVLEARDMASRLSTLRPLGSYRMRIEGGSGITVVLDTLRGDLQLAGSGQWIGSRLRFAGEASAAPEREAALANLLNIIGRRNGPRSLITLG